MRENFKNQIPFIEQELSAMKTPLNFQDIVHIYRWIFRSQITLSSLKPNIQEEFKKTEHYEVLKRKNKL